MLKVVKYIYKKVKMKNITIFLSFCWFLWVSKIFTISTLFHNGFPDIPAAASLITTTEINIENLLNEKSSKNSHNYNETTTENGAIDIVEVLKIENLNEHNDSNIAEQHSVKKEILFSEDVPPDGQVDMINDSGGTNGKPANYKDDAIINPDNETTFKEVNLTVDENQIPVFSEWAQKRMEEAEKKLEKDTVNASTQKKNSTFGHKAPVLKLSAKNYASPDCGAKIIAANPEASSTHFVLNFIKDEYLLSPCTSRIWFVVELCEAIQAEVVDLANFELFSSAPKNFSVSVANRFPTREWKNVGKFTAKDERNIQTFDLHPHLFGKYVRVDIHSHYNSEHFCPISLFRVYGTSEFEAFETENSVHTIDDDLGDDDHEADDLKAPKNNDGNNIFKSASDAVMSIVKKAASFVKPNDNKTEVNSMKSLQNLPNSTCITTNYIISCKNCSKNLSHEVSDLLSCKHNVLTRLLSVELIKNSIYKSQICANLVGLDISFSCRDQISNVSVKYLTDLHKDYISNMIPISYVAAMCNILAASDRKSKINTSQTETLDASINVTIDKKNSDNLLMLNEKENKTFQMDDLHSAIDNKTPESEAQNNISFGDTPQKYEESLPLPPVNNIEQTIQSEDKIVPTKTLDEPELSQKQQPQAIDEPENLNSNEHLKKDMSGSAKIDPSAKEMEKIVVKETILPDTNVNNSNNWENIDVFLSEATTVTSELQDTITADDHIGNTATVPQVGQKVHPESVFLRLSNRIKALERNMSLSGQYLEELSRQYKKQVEELQLSFAKTLSIIEEQNKKSTDREQVLYEQIVSLREDFDELNNRIFSWINICIYIGGFAFVQIGVIWIILKIWSKKNNKSENNNSNVQLRNKKSMRLIRVRRNSVDGATSQLSPMSKKRRPSEEALHITGTYKDLLILEEEIYNGNPETEEYDTFGEISKRNGKNKKVKIANVKRTASLEPLEKRKKPLIRQDSAPGDFERLKQLYTPRNRINEQPVLDEDYEVYVPGTDLVYNEFMPEGPSGESTINHAINGDITESSSINTKNKKQSKSRRLSSPAFLKSPFSRSQNNKKLSHGTATGWEWYRLKKGTNASQDKNMKKSKSESPEVRTNGLNNLPRPLHTDISNSNDSVKTSTTTTSASNSSDKKQGSFRRILKKVF